MRELLELICSLPDTPGHPMDDKNYLEAWEKVGALVVYHQNLYLNKIFYGFFNKETSADDLIPIVIELLPNDRTLLKKALEKLDLALYVQVQNPSDELNGAQYFLTNVFTAVTAKLAPQSIKTPKEEEVRIRKVVNEVRKLETLARACEDYSLSLMNDLEKIIARIPEVYQLYFKPEFSREQIFLSISNDVRIGDFPLKFDAPTMVPITKKAAQFLALRDIYYTLVRADYPKKRAEELQHKLTSYKGVLRQQLDNIPLQFLQDVCNYAQFYLSPAARFFILSSQFTAPEEIAQHAKQNNP